MTRRRRLRPAHLRGHVEPYETWFASVCPPLLHAPQTRMVERRSGWPAELKLAGHPSSLTVTTQTPGGASRLQPIHAPGTAQED
jgi:hypothetical protein